MRHGAALSAVVLCAASGGGAFSAPSAADLVKTASQSIAKARTYQAVFAVSTHAANVPVLRVDVDVKMVAGRKLRVAIRPMGVVIVDDGKTQWHWRSATGAYARFPSAVGRGRVGLPALGIAVPTGSCRLLRTERAVGRLTWVVEIASRPNRGLGRPARTLVYLDQKTGRMVQMKSGGPSGDQQGLSRQTTITTIVRSEKIDAPIPAASFTFSPPAGAIERKGEFVPLGDQGSMVVGEPRR